MLDTFEIITTSGVVLWSKTYVPVGPSLINNLIREVFIEERGANARADNSGGQKPTYKRDGYTLKWTAAKDLGLIFVVCCNCDSFPCARGCCGGITAKMAN
jgi:signal recognition particle receptor subunit alpha